MSKIRSEHVFTSESVSEGHPDKLCDAISDAILDECLRQDPTSRVGCECYATTNHVIIGGEITTKANIDYGKVVTKVLSELGYSNLKNFRLLTEVSKQSPDIALGVDSGGAGDQGLMFGYASALRSISAGRGTFSMQFSHYEQVPESIVAKMEKK